MIGSQIIACCFWGAVVLVAGLYIAALIRDEVNRRHASRDLERTAARLTGTDREWIIRDRRPR